MVRVGRGTGVESTSSGLNIIFSRRRGLLGGERVSGGKVRGAAGGMALDSPSISSSATEGIFAQVGPPPQLDVLGGIYVI